MMKIERLLTGDGRWLLVSLALVILGLGVLTVRAQEPTIPATIPDAEAGLSLFAERCAPCHGPTGAGDGEMAVNLPAAPQAFADPDYRKTALPGVMFDTVHNGRLEAGMPPFGMGTENSNPIEDANIWNLIAAVFSLATPAQAVAQGQALYEENCAACHGENGAGDGLDAAGQEGPGLDLTSLSYWFSRSNEMVMAGLTSSTVPEHDNGLSEEEQWAVLDYARSFSFVYVDPLAPAAPIESAMIRGQVNNGTTGEAYIGATARLRAFTTSFEETLNITTTVDADGIYQFPLEMVSPDLVYLASVVYDQLTFSSDAGQLSRTMTELDLPITVYEQTTDPAVVNIDQIHVIMEFFEGGMSVSEVYIVSNRAAAVFMGETGQADSGTIRIGLPEAAQNVMFERTMGTMDTTIPATEIIETETGWVDTLPVRPGQGGLNLIVRYDLPYQNGTELSHPLYYNTSNVSLILPEVGIELEGEGWNFQGSQQMSTNNTFLAYDRANVPAGDDLAFSLRGEPRLGATSSANALSPRNQTTDLLIGGGILLVAVAASVYVVRSWQSPPAVEEYDQEDESDDANQLIRAIANLDDAFESGQIDEVTYRADRERLKTALRSIWE